MRHVSAAAGPAAANSSRLQQVLDAIDTLNRQDPRTVDWQGQQLPYELAYSMWLTGWVEQLEPSPSEELRIVARGQHVERWKSPRSSFPEVSPAADAVLCWTGEAVCALQQVYVAACKSKSSARCRFVHDSRQGSD